MTDYTARIEELVSDRKKFNETVYTDVWEAVKEIKKRWEDKGLEKKVNEYLGGDIPKPLVEGFKVMLGRQVYTPNYELHRFMLNNGEKKDYKFSTYYSWYVSERMKKYPKIKRRE